MSATEQNNDNIFSRIFSNFFNDEDDLNDESTLNLALDEAKELNKTENTATKDDIPLPDQKTPATKDSDPLFPEKHYEKEAKSTYGDDADPTLVEQMEKDEYFKKTMERTSKQEGGYVNNEEDPGGETKYGISKKAYPNEDIENLTKERADMLYYRDYYKHNNVDKLPEHIRGEVFDNSVNQGPSQAAKNLQRAVSVKDDGIIGPQTIDAVNNANPEETMEKFKQNVLGVYDAIRVNNPDNYNKHKNGWMNRTKSY